MPRFGGASIPPSAPYPLIGEMWRAEDWYHMETHANPAYKVSLFFLPHNNVRESLLIM